MEKPKTARDYRMYTAAPKKRTKDVFLGSPSEGELHRGDVVLKVGDRDTSRLTHGEATEVIRNSGNSLKLLVQRGAGPYSPATTPTASSTAHPLTISPPAFRPPGPPSYHSPMSPGVTITTQNVSVPTQMPMQDGQYSYELRQGFLVPEPLVENKIDSIKEQAKITSQTYRTTPLITPTAKPRRDVLIGSYLRHVKEPYFTTMKMPVEGGVSNPQEIARRVQESVNTGGGPHVNVAPVVAPAGESGPKYVNRQYNTPLNLYSNQSLAETISAQTGAQLNPQNLQPGDSSTPTNLATVLKDIILGAASEIRSGSTTPQAHSPRGGAATIKPGSKMASVADITLSPTYQMIHNEEWRDIRKEDLQEQRPVQNQLYEVQSDGHVVNTFGMPRHKIHQSNSFKTIMTTVMTPKLL
ncbi:uncharacterized protein LOC135368500 isoform X2 [Ornithodoros turicata]|uniref:uncharacterized protein LOC135368500 isoform X2 n=1 Tax=Ornithodoros turicata TaxID=34597 RepID=UPI003139DB46